MDERTALRDEIAAHKAAIRRHRGEMQIAAARLEHLECAQIGIAIISKQAQRKESLAWPSPQSST